MKKLLLASALLFTFSCWASQLPTPQDKFKEIAALVDAHPFMHKDTNGTSTEITNCDETARKFIGLLNGKKIDVEFTKNIVHAALTNFDGTIIKDRHELGAVEFVDGNINSDHTLFKHLCNKPTHNKPEHVLYFIIARMDSYTAGYYHSFVVEKFYDGINDPWCRIYQSWEDNFTLRQWLGITPSTNLHDAHQTKIDWFGKGKRLSKGHMLKFFTILGLHKTLYYCLTPFALSTPDFKSYPVTKKTLKNNFVAPQKSHTTACTPNCVIS